MSLSASTLRILLKHGVDADAIVEAAEAAEAEAAAEKEARLVKRRDSNRRRQRAWYDRNIRNNEDNGVSSCDNQANAVMQHEEREETNEQRSPTPPKNSPEVINPSLPSEAQAPLPSKPRRFDWPSDFEDRFWVAYPRHTDRKKAMAALIRIRRADRVDFAEIIAGCVRLAEAGIDPAYLPHPTTWLNNERWSDEIPARGRQQARASPNGRSSTQQSFLDAARGYHDELTGEVGPDDEGPFAHSGRHASADGYGNGHAGPRYDQPAGERLRLAPPRPAGPPRPH